MVTRLHSPAIDPVPRHADVAVVGSGPLAAACTLELARAGRHVVTLGRLESDVAALAPWQSLTHALVPAGPMAKLAELAEQRWLALQEEAAADPELPLGLGALGGYYVAADQATKRALGEGALGLPASGATRLSKLQLARAVPQLGPGHWGGYRCPRDQQLDPDLATTWLLARAIEAGAVVAQAGATRVVARSGKVVGVNTDRGLIETPQVINTDDSSLAQRDPGWIPLERDAFIVYDAPRLDASLYLITDADARYPDVSLTPGPPGCIMITGVSRHGLDTRGRDLAVLREIARKAVWLMPALAYAHPGGQLRYRRLLSPDGVAVIGAEPRLTGLWHACGMASEAAALAPAVARLIAAQVTGSEPPIDVAPFDPARLSDIESTDERVAATASALGYREWDELDTDQVLQRFPMPAIPDPADAYAEPVLDVDVADVAVVDVAQLDVVEVDAAEEGSAASPVDVPRAAETDEPADHPAAGAASDAVAVSDAEELAAKPTDAPPAAASDGSTAAVDKPEAATDPLGEAAVDEPEAATDPLGEASETNLVEVEVEVEAEVEAGVESEDAGAAGDSPKAREPVSRETDNGDDAPDALKDGATLSLLRSRERFAWPSWPESGTRPTPVDEPEPPVDESKLPADESKLPADDLKLADEPEPPVDEPELPVDDSKLPVDESKPAAVSAASGVAAPGAGRPEPKRSRPAAPAPGTKRPAAPKTQAKRGTKRGASSAPRPRKGPKSAAAAGATNKSADSDVDSAALDWAHGDELVAWPSDASREATGAARKSAPKPTKAGAGANQVRRGRPARSSGPRSVTSISATTSATRRQASDEPKDEA